MKFLATVCCCWRKERLSDRAKMDKREPNRLTITVVAVSAVAVCLAVTFAIYGEWWRSEYTIKVGFPTASGVSSGTPVRNNGRMIGRVSDVVSNEAGVVVTMRIDQRQPLQLNDHAKILVGSSPGDRAVIEFVRDVNDPNTGLIQDGDYLPRRGLPPGQNSPPPQTTPAHAP